MKNQNTININENVQEQRRASKLDMFADKVRPYCKKFSKFCDKVLEKAPEVAFKFGKWIRRFIRRCINTAVQLSIIAIAVILVFSFFEAHPAEWTHCVSTFQNAWTSVKSAIAYPVVKFSEILMNSIAQIVG